jgi:hypothetical protein
MTYAGNLITRIVAYALLILAVLAASGTDLRALLFQLQ